MEVSGRRVVFFALTLLSHPNREGSRVKKTKNVCCNMEARARLGANLLRWMKRKNVRVYLALLARESSPGAFWICVKKFQKTDEKRKKNARERRRKEEGKWVESRAAKWTRDLRLVLNMSCCCIMRVQSIWVGLVTPPSCSTSSKLCRLLARFRIHSLDVRISDSTHISLCSTRPQQRSGFIHSSTPAHSSFLSSLYRLFHVSPILCCNNFPLLSTPSRTLVAFRLSYGKERRSEIKAQKN